MINTLIKYDTPNPVCMFIPLLNYITPIALMGEYVLRGCVYQDTKICLEKYEILS